MNPEVLYRKKIKAKENKIAIISSILLYVSFFGHFPYEISDLNEQINERWIIKDIKLKKRIFNLFKIIYNVLLFIKRKKGMILI